MKVREKKNKGDWVRIFATLDQHLRTSKKQFVFMKWGAGFHTVKGVGMRGAI